MLDYCIAHKLANHKLIFVFVFSFEDHLEATISTESL